MGCHCGKEAVWINDDKYYVLSRIAEGGFGVVQLVEEARTAQLFALKKVKCDNKSDLDKARTENNYFRQLNGNANLVQLLHEQVRDERSTAAGAFVIYSLFPYYQKIRSFINATYYERNRSLLDESALKSIWAFTVAIFAVGGGIGGLSNGFFGDYFGRKRSLLYNNGLGLLGAALMGLAKPCRSYEMIAAGRFVIGLNCGLNSGLCPTYITELAPVQIRGSIGLLFQLGAVSSIMLSQVLGLPDLLGTDTLWPVLLGFTGIFAVFQLTTLPFCPESPRYLLINRQQRAEAESALRLLRGTDNVKQEMDDMSDEAATNASRAGKTFNMLQLFTTRALLMPTLVSIMLHLSQQLSGINAVFYYSSDILKKSGIEKAEYATPFIGLIMVVMCLVSIPLIEKSGRRFLHLLGLGGMFVFSILMTIAFVLQATHDWLKYLSIVSMMLYIVFFAIGPGSIPWMMVAELFAQDSRSAAVSLAVLVNWSANVAVGQGFPPLFDTVTKEWTFLLFTGFLAIFWLFMFAFLPETKNRRVDDIVKHFQSGHSLLVFRTKRNSTVNTDKEDKEDFEEAS